MSPISAYRANEKCLTRPNAGHSMLARCHLQCSFCVLFPARSDFGSCLLGRILASPRSQPTFKGDPGSEAVLHLRTIPAAYSTRAYLCSRLPLRFVMGLGPCPEDRNKTSWMAWIRRQHVHQRQRRNNMSRKDRSEDFWVSENAARSRRRDAENGRRNRAEITKALSHGQISRRDLVKWGLFTSAGILAPIGGLSPFVRPLHAQTTSSFSGGSCSAIPTGLPTSPTFGVQPFTQPMPRFDVLARNAVATLSPAPTAQANTTQQPVDPRLVGGQTGLTGPIEGRPPGANWAHQGFAQFPPQIAVEITTKEVTTNTSYSPGVTSDLNSGINPATPIPPKFHPSFPVQNANRVWTFNGTFPPKLLQVRYGEPVLMRHHNGLTTDITNNGGFGRFTLTTHEHNAHHAAENDGL